MKWDKIQLGETATFLNGYPFKPSDWANSGKEIIRIQNLTKSSKETNRFTGEIPKRYLVKKGDLLISWSATLGVYEWNGEDAWLNQHIFKVILDKREIDKRFFKYLIESKLHELEKQVHGATMKHITKEKFDKVPVTLPPLPIQKQIAETLDQADALRKKDQELLQKYDELSQAIFYEMFGDPAHNKKGWEIMQLRDVVSNEKYSLKRGPFGGALKKEIFKPSGYLVYEQYHAINDAYDLARYFIDEDQFKILEAFEVIPGDLIVSCSGVTLGRVSELPTNALPGIINQALLKIKLDQTIMRNDFFIFQFRGEFVQSKLFEFSRGSGIPNFPPMEDVKSIEFVVPPIELQKKFCDIYRNIEIQKQKVSLKESGLMFQTIIAQSFN